MDTASTGDLVVPNLFEKRRGGDRRADHQARLELALDASGVGLWDWDLSTGVLSWDQRCCTIFGVPPYAAMTYARYLALLDPADRDQAHRLVATALEPSGGGRFATEHYITTPAGERRFVAVRARALFADAVNGRRATKLVGTVLDMTERHRSEPEREQLHEQLQERLRQAQKMEAVGQLAGGIAHDFNNLLTVITGNLEFASTDLPLGHPVRGDLQEIAHATERARELVRQLLAFSRKQALSLQPVNLSSVVSAAESMLRRVIGEEIVLDVHLDTALPSIRADRGQLEQVLMNLAVNARDAMLTAANGTRGHGGTLQIETAKVELTEHDVQAIPDVPPGAAVRLRVRDSGHGMDEATRLRAFEPFFTTKGVGQGTGLGLATVFGIVKQFGGSITLESIPGSGSLFSLYFPIHDGVVAAPPVLPDSAHSTSTATILLVEDEAAVRNAARRMLERRGYTVLEARHGADALLVWREKRATIDAVVTDLRMPEMGGRELVQQLRAEQPALPVVYMSGYSEQSVPDADAMRTAFLEKPFTMDGLIGAVERVLAQVAA
ncbi:response regulator [Gemmatimonas sp.]|uniref:response regulator n=1 Tax=Gemmatimonas sp. TaxID=1962908 RepID=UPI003F707E96